MRIGERRRYYISSEALAAEWRLQDRLHDNDDEEEKKEVGRLLSCKYPKILSTAAVVVADAAAVVADAAAVVADARLVLGDLGLTRSMIQ